jgi:hypothetical protein
MTSFVDGILPSGLAPRLIIRLFVQQSPMAEAIGD